MNCDQAREWLSWEIDGELGNGRQRELREHLSECAECARAAEEMRAAHADIARAMESSRAPQSLEKRILAAAQKEAESSRRAARARWRPIFRIASVSAAVILIGFGVAAFNIGTMEASAQEVSVFGNLSYEADAPAAVRVMVRDARKNAPVAGAPVTLSLGGRPLGTYTTDARGAIAGRIRMPDLPEGTYPLEVVVGGDRVRRDVTLRRSHRVLVTSDKPMYQPGQTIRLRALALGAMTLRPTAGRTATFTVTDPRGNRIFRREMPTSEFGIAAADVELADEITLGRYRIACEVDKVASEKTVEVKRYVLPRFRTALEVEKAYYRPGEPIRGTVRADYFFGKSVERGRVHVALSAFHVDDFRTFATIEGMTDAAGAFAWDAKVPDTLFGIDLLRGRALVRVEATVTDGSGHAERGTRALTVSGETLKIDVLPADGALIDRVEKRLMVVATYPDGSAAPKVRLEFRQGEWASSAETNDAGVAEIVVPELTPLRVSGKDAKGHEASQTVEIGRFRRLRPFILRTDRATYRGGQTMNVTVLSHRPGGAVYLDVIKAGQTVLTQSAELESGRALAAIDLPADLAGTLQVSAYSIEPDGSVARVSRVVHVNLPEQLRIRPKLSKETYRPGEEVVVDFEVVDADGKPARAALGVSVVDEALFHLSESRPGLEAVYFSIVDDLLKPAVEDHGHAIFSAAASDLLGDERAMQLRSAAAGESDVKFERLGRVLSEEKAVAVERLQREYWNRLMSALAIVVGLVVVLGLVGLYGVPLWLSLREGKSLAGVGVWTGLLFAIGTMAIAVLNDGMITRVGIVAVGILSAGTVLVVYAAIGWHSRGRVAASIVAVMLPLVAFLASGVMLAGSRKDASIDGDLTGRMRAARDQIAGATVMAAPPPPKREAAPGAKPAETEVPSDPRKPGADPAVRIREYFPETLYWNPQIITDENGRARLAFPGADSITSWRMSSQGVSARGQLGGHVADLRVFQDFFVDIDFPVALTAGDAVSVPIAVFNYLKEPQTVRLKVEKEDWFELLDDAEKTVEMKANEVKGARYLIRAAKPGVKRLTVKAFGSKGLNDAVRRSVEIRPNGREVEIAVGDRIAGSVRSRFEIPRDAIDGGTVVVVRVAPGGVGEVVKGLDSMIRMPHG